MFAHKCPHCGKITAYFDEEIPYREFGLEGEGTVTIYHCDHCGAVITVMVPENEEFLVILGADVDMEKASKQGFINIKEQ